MEQTRLRRLEQDYLRQELALRQQERLAVLGRLSAGLGHELNNPAAAALASSRRLRESLVSADALMPRIAEDPHCAELVAALRESLTLPADDGPPGGSSAGSAERVEAVEEVLAAHGIPQPWNPADELASTGTSASAVEVALGTRADSGLALEWLRARTQIRSALARISTSVERMAELTSALRRYSYLDRAPQQDVDVRAGLDDTVTILAHKITDRVQIVRRYAVDVPRIQAYGGQLNQVWTNLIDNAVEAVGDAGTITVAARPGDGGVVVQVVDDGIGIPPDVIATIFDPFVTTKPPGQGTGLGLNVAHQIIADVHGGRLQVESEPGHTAFTVWLPLAPVKANEHER